LDQAMKRLACLPIVALAATALFTVRPADAAGTQNVIAHSTAGYANPAIVIEEGDALDFTNADPLGINHNVVEENGSRFGSATVPSGTVPVDGVESLTPGTYQFFCSLHPWMKGVLQVEASLPATPPRLDPPDPSGPAPVVALPGGIVPTPTAVHATADALYVASYAQGGIVRLPIVEGGLLGLPETVASGFTNPLGVVVDEDGTVFVADSHAGAGGRTVGRVQAVTADGTQLVVDGLPNGRHNTNNLAIHGGRLYIANGNATDDGINGGSPELPLNGTLLSVDVTARDLVVGPDGDAVAGITVEATGMRNVYDVAFRPGTNEAWLTTNGPDTFDPYGEDTLVKVDDVTSAVAPDFGFPECLYDAAGTILDNPVTPGTCGDHTPPAALLGLHVSANGIAFGPDGHAYIALFGNFYGESVVGHKIVRVPIDASGAVTGPPEDVVASAAPLDVTFGPAGLYVADFATGTILLQVV
jgi:glucose/arabinose dehydrogenase/plastocyanin